MTSEPLYNGSAPSVPSGPISLSIERMTEYLRMRGWTDFEIMGFMQYALPEGNSSQLAADHKRVSDALLRMQKPPQEKLFRYISPYVTDEEERLRVHRQICHFVRGDWPMSYICEQLKSLDRDGKIALRVSQEEQFEELIRLGLDTTKKGNTFKNYKNYI